VDLLHPHNLVLNYTPGTFSIPITKDPQPAGPNVYHIPTNDHNGILRDISVLLPLLTHQILGADTLHGGIYGWDRRTWTITEKNSTSVTYMHYDNADEGFPGIVITTVRARSPSLCTRPTRLTSD
jgi:aldose 1-epimerase